MELGKIGVWTWLDHLSANEAAEFAGRAENWGYSALWIPEAVGRDPFALIGFLAARTERLILATGIANIYARDPMATKAIWKFTGKLGQPYQVHGKRSASICGIPDFDGRTP